MPTNASRKKLYGKTKAVGTKTKKKKKTTAKKKTTGGY
jgi:hypothetical protein